MRLFCLSCFAYPLAPEAWPTCANLLPHALAATAYTEAQEIAAEATAGLLNQAGEYLYIRADFSGAQAVLERDLAIRESELGEKHPDTALCLNNLGSLLRSRGDLEGAKPYLERALAIRESVMGAEHPITATSLNSLGSLLQDQGDLEGAKSYLERALAIVESVLGTDHLNTQIVRDNLADLLRALSTPSNAPPSR